jgi:hypothetical protein
MSWYIKTLRASLSGFTCRSRNHINNSNSNYQINWFRALCHRRITDVNWFSNQPNQIQNIITAHVQARVVVLQRILIKDTILHKCRVIEQCQASDEPNVNQFWRLCTPCYTGFDPNLTIKNIFISNRYLLMFISSPEGSSKDYQLPGSMLVWPVNRIATMPPRCLSYPYSGSVNVRDYWAMFNYSVKKPDTRKVEAVIIHVLNLNTDRVCVNVFNSLITWSFIQRITADTVTVVRVSFEGFHSTTPVKWSIWEFSSVLSENTPCCLMEGSFVVSGFNDLIPLVERLDDDRIIIRCCTFRNNDQSLGNNDNSNNNDSSDANVLTLVVISTRDKSNKFLTDQQPVWSCSILMKVAKPLISLNQVIVVTSDGCTIYDLDNGDALAFTPMNTIQSLLQQHCMTNSQYHLKMTTSYVQGYVLCESIDDTSYVAVDLIRTERTGKLKLAHMFEHYNINAS